MKIYDWKFFVVLILFNPIGRAEFFNPPGNHAGDEAFVRPTGEALTPKALAILKLGQIIADIEKSSEAHFPRFENLNRDGVFTDRSLRDSFNSSVESFKKSLLDPTFGYQPRMKQVVNLMKNLNCSGEQGGGSGGGISGPVRNPGGIQVTKGECVYPGKLKGHLITPDGQIKEFEEDCALDLKKYSCGSCNVDLEGRLWRGTYKLMYDGKGVDSGSGDSSGEIGDAREKCEKSRKEDKRCNL